MVIGVVFGIGFVVKIAESVGTEIGKSLDPILQDFSERIARWTRPLWEERHPAERDLRNLNRYLEDLNRMTDEHQKRIGIR